MTEVIGANGKVLTSITRTGEESGGNPSWVTRMAHRVTEAQADQTRQMLQPMYGEIEAAWVA